MDPFQKIAGDLRRRISAGELRPGDPVPSTRALARQWQVATATAAHALQVLALEGWVVGRPRVGTVVAEAAPHPRARRELDRDRIVAAAIHIADEQGAGALTLRGVAAQLDAPVMSLYRHVSSKAELLERMIDRVLGESALPAVRPAGWREAIEVSARQQWQALKAHPWLARAMSITRPSASPNGVAHAEWVLAALDGHGLDAAERMRMHVVLYSFVQGIAVNLESEAEARGETGITDDEWIDGQLASFEALGASGRYPAFGAVMAELDQGFELDFDQLFELGLRALLDGFAQRLGER